MRRAPGGFWRIAGSAGWLIAEHALRLLAGLLVGVWVARHLGPHSFGVLNYAISFVFLFSALGRLGLDNLVVRDLVADPRHQAETLGGALILRLAGGSLAFGLIAAAAFATQADPTTRLAILIIGAGLIVQALEVGAYGFYARTLARPVALARLISLGVISALRIGLILLDMPVIWFALPVVLDSALAATLMLVFYLRDGTMPRLRRPRLARVRAMLAEAWPLAFSIALVELQQRIDQVMLGAMLGAEEVGWYAAAARLSQMAYVLPTVLATVLFPSILLARQTSRARYQGRLQGFYDLMLWLGVAVALPGTLLAGPIVAILYGDAFASSATILKIHLWSVVLVGVGVARRHWLVAEGLTRFVLLTSLAAVVGNVALNAVLIPAYAGPGAASATLLALVVGGYLTNYGHVRLRSARVMINRALLAPVTRSLALMRQASPARSDSPHAPR